VKHRNLICFDYGEKRIGVAVGQDVTETATPLETIPVRRGRPDWQRIEALIREWQPGALVVGDPVTMDGARQRATEAADRFARQLSGRFRLPVHRADERMSSLEARSRLGRTRDLDAVAAQVILESWLAEQHKHAAPAPQAAEAERS
jgi:putative Holliday junction resolvase